MFELVLSLVLLVAVILCGGMITILERKVLGMSHRRVSLNSAGWWGLIQIAGDGVKVILKQQRLKLQIVPMYAFGALLFLIFLFDDVLSVSLVWVVVLQGLHLMIMVYVAVGSGVKWMVMGIYRLVSVFMIYDVGLLLVFSILNEGVFLSVLVSLVWITLILLDCGRTPFDLAECESELVSGYTTEYGGSIFAFFASMEYGLMLWSVILFTVVCGDGVGVCSLVVVCLILIRGLLPRVYIKDLWEVGFVWWAVCLV